MDFLIVFKDEESIYIISFIYLKFNFFTRYFLFKIRQTSWMTHSLITSFYWIFFVIRYEEVPDEWEPPEPQPYVDQGNLHYYMLDQDAYDQYYIVTGGGSNVQIWQNTAPDPTKLEERAVRSRTVTQILSISSVLWFSPNNNVL